MVLEDEAALEILDVVAALVAFLLGEPMRAYLSPLLLLFLLLGHLEPGLFAPRPQRVLVACQLQVSSKSCAAAQQEQEQEQA